MCRTRNSRTALSLEETPSWSMFQRSVLEPKVVTMPLVGAKTFVMTKSGFTISRISMLVAPTLEMFAARSANSCSRSDGSGVTATWDASGSVAQSFSALTSTPSEPTRPMQ